MRKVFHETEQENGNVESVLQILKVFNDFFDRWLIQAS